jgi:predicted nuclease of restriction endonuclease-like (RecB) superfamily
MKDLIVGPDYAGWLVDLKSRIQRARSQAALAVNQELVRLYHHLGSEILARQDRQGWGAKVIDRLAMDLRAAFPDMKGLSASNLKYMRFFAELCPALQIGQQAADQLPWFHIVTLLTKVTDPDQREWYAIRAVERAWSRATLQVNIVDGNPGRVPIPSRDGARPAKPAGSPRAEAQPHLREVWQ